MTLLAFLASTFLSTAEADSCGKYVTQAASQEGAGLVRTFAQLAQCDKAMAEDNFLGAFVPRATDLDTLVQLSETAITAGVFNSTWKMLGKISDYSVRNEVAAGIGAKCDSNPQVMKFLQGAYFALKNNDFTKWDDAYVACESAEMTTWFEQQITNTPKGSFSESYNTLLDIYVKQQKANALPLLQKAALNTKDEGPFDVIINQMNNAVQPGLGETMSDADRSAFEESILAIAKEVPSKALLLAQQLNSVNSTRSGELLKIIYADRMTDGLLSYGVVAVEAGECKGKLQAVLHVATVTDPAKRMVVLQDATGPIRASKPKLKKCETGEWPISITSEPIASTELDTLISELTAKYEGEGYKVKVATEATIALD
jgi:hypothetical protein